MPADGGGPADAVAVPPAPPPADRTPPIGAAARPARPMPAAEPAPRPAPPPVPPREEDEELPEPFSPVCYASEVDPAYTGLASPQPEPTDPAKR